MITAAVLDFIGVVGRSEGVAAVTKTAEVGG